MLKHFHVTTFIIALLAIYIVGGVILKYIVLDNVPSAVSGIETMTAATANSLSTSMTYDASEYSNFKETITASSSVFKITKDEMTIVYDLGQESQNASLFCVVGKAGYTVVSLAQNGTLSGADILPLARDCIPEIFTIKDLVGAIHEGTIYVVQSSGRMLLK